MNVSGKLLYRVSAVLIALYAAAHAAGFWTVDPAWGVDAVVEGMKSSEFDVMGFRRRYWDFFIGFGTVVTLLMTFTALVAWQLGALAAAMPRALRPVAWGLALAYVLMSAMMWLWFFLPPIVFSTVIALCLLVAAARTRYAENRSSNDA